MTRNILFLGGGIDAVEIIKRAHKMGLIISVMDYDRDCPGRTWANFFVQASCYHIEPALDATPELIKVVGKLDGVMCAGTDAPHVAAAISNILSLPGITPTSAYISKNKIGQMIAFQNAGIRIPESVISWGPSNELRRPMVVKPDDSRGARGVSRVVRRGPIPLFLARRRASKHGRPICQEWIDGAQLSSESIIIDGKVVWTAFAERNYDRLDEFVPYVIEDGSDMPPMIEGFEDKANAEIQKCVDVLHMQNGTLKGDLVWDGENIWVIEVAARLSGGSFCSEMTPECWDVDFVGIAIRLALGERVDPASINPRFRKYVCQRFAFPVKPKCHPDRGEGVIAFGNSREEARMRAAAEVR
ncbi:MAG: ATP-grasp domain-containing protein [Proteobacteria bacterium]|nr:ATP-grasp domain-containing protein [Pseudomonadota bacterium]